MSREPQRPGLPLWLPLALAACGPSSPADKPKSFRCDETKDPDAPCIELDDGSTWDVGATVVVPMPGENRAAVVVASGLQCEFSNWQHDRGDYFSSVCANLYNTSSTWEDAHQADGRWGGLWSNYALATGFHFGWTQEGGISPGSWSAIEVWRCDEETVEAEEGGGSYYHGELDTLTDGTVTLTDAETDHATVDFDFDGARGRLVARVCPEQYER